MSNYNYIVTSTFGLEATVKREVQSLGFKDISVTDGRIQFSGDLSAIPKANINIRSGDRVLIVMGEFKAMSFEELFERTKAIPWEEWIPIDGKFTVVGKSVKSKLFSVSDCQSIVKKAIVEKLKIKYNTDWFTEDGASYKVQVALLRDIATLTIDTTGAGLHKRGYRQNAVTAPLKETLAAALIELSYFRPNRLLIDPFCGSGTIPIEAALMAKSIAPGLNREFVAETWDNIPKRLWQDERDLCRSKIKVDFKPEIFGYDIDPKSIQQAKENARLAGVSDDIIFTSKAFSDVSFHQDDGIIICNPPYGERIGEQEEVKELYKLMGRVLKNKYTWNTYVLTSNEEFEKLFGRKADKKRKLFNGMIEACYYQYYGVKPKKS